MPILAGVDYGTRRIGLAISDASGTIASPLKTLAASGDSTGDARAVSSAVAEFDVAEWVVGWPLNMDGSPGPQARLSEEFAAALRACTGQPVHLFDERLSSQEADTKMAMSGLTHKKKKARRDALAALVILQSYLDERNQRLE